MITCSGFINILFFCDKSHDVAFYASRILGLRWERVKEERITNEEVRKCFKNIPNTETFIVRRTNRYIGEIVRSEKNNIRRKLLGAWIYCPRKTGRPQNSCYNNFFKAIRAIVPQT